MMMTTFTSAQCAVLLTALLATGGSALAAAPLPPQKAAVLPPVSAVPSALSPTTSACQDTASLTAPLLYGRWAVRYTNPPVNLPATATLVLQRHAEFSESLAGTVTRSVTGSAPTLAALAGDIDGVLLLLDESADKVRITATWNGEAVPGSCGTEFSGLWKDMTAAADNAPSVVFTLKKIP